MDKAAARKLHVNKSNFADTEVSNVYGLDSSLMFGINIYDWIKVLPLSWTTQYTDNKGSDGL